MSEIWNSLAYLSMVWIFLVVVFPQERKPATGHYWVFFPENFRQFGPWSCEIWCFLCRTSIFSCKLGNLEKNGHSSPHGPPKFFWKFCFKSMCLKTTIWTNLAKKTEPNFSERKTLETRLKYKQLSISVFFNFCQFRFSYLVINWPPFQNDLNW